MTPRISNRFLSFATVILALTTASTVSGQRRDTLFDFKRIATDVITLPAPKSSITIAVNGISVQDKRYDTTVVGFNKLNAILLGGNAAAEISKHLNAGFTFDNNTSNSVVLYIKTFWMGNQLGINSEGVGPDKGKWKQGVVCKMECFYKQDGAQYALFRYDTTLLAKEKLEDEAVGLITHCLERVGQKITSSVASFHTGKTKMTDDEVAKYYNKRFDVPILRDTMLRKGVYRTFAEFQANKPFHSEFFVYFDKTNDWLDLVDSTGKETMVRDMWGYCDGSRVFIKSIDNYFQMVRVGNSFYLKGFKDVEQWTIDTYGRPIAITNFTTGERKYHFGGAKGEKVKYKVFYKPYQLNMENGEIY